MDPYDPNLSLDERKFQQDEKFKGIELAIKRREIAAKVQELNRSRWLNPTVLGLFAAAIGLIGNIFVARFNNRSTTAVQHATAQSNLIVQAVSTGSYDSACRNIKSLIVLGLLDDPGGRLSLCGTVPSSIPVLPSNSQRTYVPEGDHNFQEMHLLITRKDSQATAFFHVKLTVPEPLTALKDMHKFNLIRVYAAKVSPDGERIDERDLTPIQGNWHSGQNIEFDTQLPEEFLSDKVNTTTLRFCVGSAESCYPSPNLLLPARSF